MEFCAKQITLISPVSRICGVKIFRLCAPVQSVYTKVTQCLCSASCLTEVLAVMCRILPSIRIVRIANEATESSFVDWPLLAFLFVSRYVTR